VTLSGLVVPTPTLFDPDGELDPVRNRHYASVLSRAGVGHLFPLGSLGEFPVLEEAERSLLVRGVREGVAGAADLWVGVGAPSTRRAVRQAVAAEEDGAAAVVAVPPYYLRPTEAAIADYYRAIRGATSLPLLAYNIPSKVGYALSPGLLRGLADGQVVNGLKDTAGSLESVRAFLKALPAGFPIFPGDDAVASAAIAEGAAGAVLGTANVAPRLGIRLVEALRHQQLDEAKRIQGVVDRLAEALARGPFPSAGKFLARYVRRADDGYRAPYVALTDDEERAVLAGYTPLAATLEEFLREP
jgi:4-hydroxy-tetrahydrodipicolinate synthase